MEELKKKALIEILARARYIDIKEDVLSAYVDVYKVVQMREEIWIFTDKSRMSFICLKADDFMLANGHKIILNVEAWKTVEVELY